jgi:hypothetical protein
LRLRDDMTNARNLSTAVALAFSVVALGGLACGDARAEQERVQPQGQASTSPDDQLYRDMAVSAWRYLDKYYQPSTGFVNATPDWYNTTVWDVGGQLLAQYSAKELGLLDAAEFQKRTATALNTLERVPLFDNTAFNRIYSTKDGAPDQGSGAGWSATDIGRLLLALKIIATHEPGFAPQIERIVRRNNFAALVKNGYVHGRARTRDGKVSDFQEGRIGYEQYVATGFAQWGADVRHALNPAANAKSVDVHGVKLLGDRRGLDRLLSEPFILMGIEVGLEGQMRSLAERVLAAQEARYKATGQVTIATEDAVAVKPHHFYYYCVYCNGKPFVVGISSPRQVLEEPRWVSVKGAFGWHALFPSEYTAKAVQHVAPALDQTHGWATGVLEKTGESTKTWDVTSAAALMEIAYFQLRGRKPLMQAASVAPVSQR